MERGSQSHRVDHERHRVVELEPDELEQVPRPIRSDGEDTWWISVRVKVDDDDRIVDRMQDVGVVDAVLACRTMDLHIGVSYYEIEGMGTPARRTRRRRDNASRHAPASTAIGWGRVQGLVRAFGGSVD